MLDYEDYTIDGDGYQGNGHHRNGYDQLEGDWHTYYKVGSSFTGKVKPEDREEIVVKGEPIMSEPNRMQTEVTNSQDAQFCNAYIYALAPCYGRKPGADWQTPSTFNDPKIKNLMKKVKVELHPKAEELAVSRIKAGESPLFHDAIVEVTTKGKKFSAEGAVAKGFLKNPLTDEELKEKFRNNASYSTLKSERVEQIIDMVYKLEKIDRIAELTEVLTVK